MIKFTDRANRSGHRAGRRSAMLAGATGLAGLTLVDVLRAESARDDGSARKSVINIHLDGGPPQLDTIDMKMSAPSEIRGEFFPVQTALPGFHVCELMPKVASIADRFAFIRSLVGSAGRHDGFQCQSGFHYRDLESMGGRPAMGSVVSKLSGEATDDAPPFVDLMLGRPLVRNSARPGFLGPAHKPFRPDISAMFHRELEKGMQGELKRLGDEHVMSMKLNEQLSLARLTGRASLLNSLDRIRRKVDASGMMDAMDAFNQQAVSLLTSGRFADALDLSQEDPRTVRRYTAAQNPSAYQFTTAEGPEAPQKFLLARRLIEAGVRCVSVSISDFDTHSKNFPRMRALLPIVDLGLYALVTDLEERGMLDEVTIVVWGEFGRTPRIDPKTGGRHHWPRVGPAMLAGGGMKTGQVIGATDRTAGSVIARPVHYKDVMATLFNRVGIDARNTTINDPQGRPQYLLDEGQPLVEVI